MKSSTIFWGVFLISLGIMFFINQFDIWFFNSEMIFKMWPLLLIIWGVSLLKINEVVKIILNGLSAFLLALFIIAFINYSWSSCCSYDDFVWEEEDKNEYYERIEKNISYDFKDNLQFAKLDLNGGACSYEFQKTNDYLLNANSKVPVRYMELETIKEDSNSIQLELNMKMGKLFWKKKSKNLVILELNDKPVWDFDINIGAVEFICNLSDFKVKNLNIDAGAANIELKVGDKYDETIINLNTGASNCEIEIPKTSGCKIETSTALSNKDFEGFIQKKDGYYTPNFNKAKKIVFINLSGGVSNFEVVRN